MIENNKNLKFVNKRSFYPLQMGLILSISIFFLFSLNAISQNKTGNDIFMNADVVDRDLKNKIITLTGNVNIIFKKQHLSSKKARIYLNENQIIAEENVIYIANNIYSEADKIEFNYKNELGVFYNGFVQAGNVTFEGSIIRKVGPINYIAENAKYSSCILCPPTWSFTGSQIEAEIGGYAYIKYPLLKILDFPVFFLPGIIVPLKSDRQSGILVPSWETSNIHGLTYSQSYFWAISRSQDLTYTLKNYEHNGLKNILEYRYMTSENSYGNLFTGHIRDRNYTSYLVDSSNPDPSTNTTRPVLKQDRWFFQYNHFFSLPENYTQRMNINLIGDLTYLKDYTEMIDGHGDPALESKISLTKSSEKINWNIESDYYLNLLNTNPNDDNFDTVHRMPEFNFTTAEIPVYDTGLFFKLKSQYLNITRRGFSYDDVSETTDGSGNIIRSVDSESDGVYHSNIDLLRTGHRLYIEPEVTYPFMVGRFLNILPSLKYRETLYKFNAKSDDLTYTPSTNRGFLQTSLSIRTQFYKPYSPDLNDMEAIKLNTSYMHKIEPEIIFSQIPYISRNNHPFFGDFESHPRHLIDSSISENDFNGVNKVQFDYQDRIFDQKFIQVGIINRITRALGNKESRQYKDIFKFGITQSYDFIEADSSDKPQPFSPVSLLLDVRLDNFETLTKYDIFTYAGIENVDSRVKVFDNRGDYAEFRYLRSHDPDLKNNVLVKDSKREHIALTLGTVNKYLNLSTTADYDNVSHKVQSWGLTSLFKLPGNCWNIVIEHKSILGGESVTSYSFDFNFGGDKFERF